MFCDTCYKEFNNEKEFSSHILLCIPSYNHIRLELENDTKSFFDNLLHIQQSKLEKLEPPPTKESENDKLRKLYDSHFSQFVLKYENMVETYEKMLEDTRKKYEDIIREKEKNYKKKEAELLNRHAGVVNSLNLTILTMKEKLTNK